VLELSGAGPDTPLDHGTLGDALLEPTTIYVRPLLELCRRVDVHALAHITGGGLTENLPRVLPPGCQARVDSGSWRWPAVFRWLAETGHIEHAEMYRTFNCGIGMVACVPEPSLEDTLACLGAQGLDAWRLGAIEAGDQGVTLTP
jgi:phosphoribosylformylglycinamidine cyclo-ligase